jgi:hypothetical protein
MLKQNDMVSPEAMMILDQKRAFLKLPLSERRRILSEQAENAAIQYEIEHSVREREVWQGGDIVEY